MDIEDLTVLLDQALGATSVIYTWGHNPPPQPMDVGEYRRLLQSFREGYNPTAREQAQHFKPVLGGDAIRAQLLAIIRSHLGAYIRDDRLKSALHATLGGFHEGFAVDDLLSHWLDIAIARGSGFAASVFLSGVSNPVQYQEMALIRGLRVGREIAIAEGVRIVPQSGSRAALPPYLPSKLEASDLPSWTDLRLTDFIHGSVLIVDKLVSPAFVDPDEDLGSVIPPYDAGVFTYEHVSDESRDFHVGQYCEALSLAVGGGMTIQSPAHWRHLDDDHICKVGFAITDAPAMSSRQQRDSRLVNATDETVEFATNLYWARKNLSRETAARLNVTIDRWTKSYEDMRIVDKFIDLGIALESLYLGGIGNELGFRFALHAAWHLGANVSEREGLMRDFRKVYDLRSRAVHSGSVEDTKTARDVLSRAQECCRWAIINIIFRGRFPDWNKMVLGDDEELESPRSHGRG